MAAGVVQSRQDAAPTEAAQASWERILLRWPSFIAGNRTTATEAAQASWQRHLAAMVQFHCRKLHYPHGSSAGLVGAASCRDGPASLQEIALPLVSMHDDSGDPLQEENVVRAVRRWVDSVVVELNLCPFAKRELVNDRVRFAVAEALSEEQLLSVLQAELELLGSDPSIETTLLIHPNVLQDFYDYNQFLSDADRLLVQMKVNGIYQIASFHPNYQFGGTAPDDAENYTNRSPYPMLHIIREESLERAIASYPDVDQIPVRNIEMMKSLGQDKLQALLQACLDQK